MHVLCHLTGSFILLIGCLLAVLSPQMANGFFIWALCGSATFIVLGIAWERSQY